MHVLPALGAKVSVVICRGEFLPDMGGKVEEECFTNTGLELGSLEADQFLSDIPRDTLVFVSGSTKFLKSLSRVLEGVTRLVVALDVHNRVSSALSALYPQLDWQRVCHADVGGVTAARNWMGISQQLAAQDIETIPFSRSIGDVLIPTLKLGCGSGRAAEKPAAPKEIPREVLFEAPGLVSPHGLWPTCSKGLKLVAPSVFSKTGWVHRRLSPTERGAAWDLPGRTMKELKAGLTDPEIESMMARVCRAAPGKVLWAVGHSMLCFGLWGDGGDFVEDDVSLGPRGFGMIVDDVLKSDKAEARGSEAEEDGKLSESKAAKADDAEVPIRMWNARIMVGLSGTPKEQDLDKSCEVLRESFLLRRWKRNLTRSLIEHMREHYGRDWLQRRNEEEVRLDLDAGREALRRAMATSWWAWDAGSALFFWRWPKEYRKEARDGTPVRVSGELPKYRRSQRLEPDELLRAKIFSKIDKIRSRGYVKRGPVVSLTSFFGVPKDVTDIRMVYDASQSGLNDVVWVPSFGLPTVDSTLRGIDTKTWLGDVDLGEMFLNFPLDAPLRPYVGIDLSAFPVREEFSSNESSGVVWERWERCLMGFKPSPYNAVRGFGWCEDIIRGCRQDSGNPLKWDRLRMNLPGSDDYDPTLPWVSKVVSDGKCERIAGEFFTYMDDIRTCGQDSDQCWEVARRVAAYCGYLGIQDAPRKRRAPSQTPGAWAGSNVVVTSEGVAVTVSQEKWDKTKQLVDKWRERLTGERDVDRKELESDVGFLIYVARTYPVMKPYLKGFHLTLHGWRQGRDDFGWKVMTREFEMDDDDWISPGGAESFKKSSGEREPKRVKPVTRFHSDLKALSELTKGATPPKRLVRPSRVRSVRYGFGDASGSGFGSTFSNADHILYRHGVWERDEEDLSSNWRELTNLVETLEGEAAASRLQGCEVFMFTDNSTAEAAFFRGTSSSERLFELVLRLRKLEMEQQCLIHLIHVAGTRMIGQGSDGLSRGDFTEGVMSGKSMISFVPLNRSAMERQPTLETWIRSWAGQQSFVLTPEDWFEKGHGIIGHKQNHLRMFMPSYSDGTFIWCPPPAAAAVAAEELRRARHKREKACHVFVCPRLMTNLWRKLVLKESDLFFEIPAGSRVWREDMCEPLLIGVCLPLIQHRPWRLAGTPKLLGVARELRRMRQEPDWDAGIVLRELFQLSRRLSTMPPKLVRQVLHAAPGRHLSY